MAELKKEQFVIKERYDPYGEYQPSVSFLLVRCLETAS
mgnify:CR=1 FL=1